MTVNASTVSFTSRERQVVQGLAEGLTDRVIARRLNRKPGTVRHHISTAKKKVGAKGQAALVDCSYDLGLIRLPALEHGTVHLPPEQRNLITLLTRSLTNGEIAAEIHRSPAQVGVYVRRLMWVLDAQSRAHVVTRARQHGLRQAARPPSSATART
ncbi:LuxR C-terminal-related transcriptional regulator [Streptomyces sp. NPDC017940]|uniref:helix-turn-helix domain-containing protein n=1 Tax=Streptomyces sp. NPDC017940 TaxID=3365017 RepID=UPI00378CE388